MASELVNVLRVSAVTPSEIAVELPEHSLSDARLPPDFVGVAASPIPPYYDPPLTTEEFLGQPASVSRVTLGVPQVVRLSAAPGGDTTGLADFLGRDPTTHYFLVHLACSFAPLPSERFVQAELRVTLSSPASAVSEAIAWSMEPRCLAQVTELSRTQKIDAGLKVVTFSTSHAETLTKTRCVIKAFNELQPDPRWEFGPTDGDELIGTQRLILIVQTTGATAGGISFTARAHRRRWPRTEEHRALQRRFGLPRHGT